jgi:hypothetical protein
MQERETIFQIVLSLEIDAVADGFLKFYYKLLVALHATKSSFRPVATIAR